MTIWTKLSESHFWNQQREYYENMGQAAWENVPFAVTNNAFIAAQYRHLTNDIFPTPHFIELGAGRGEFAFHFLNAGDYPDTYWLTDATDAYLNHWESCHDFRKWRYNNLNFANIDCHEFENPGQSTDQPTVIIANYLFDTLAHDAYILDENNHILTLHTCDKPPKDWHSFIKFNDQYKVPFKAEQIDLPNELSHYITNNYCAGSHITIPTGSLKLIEKLKTCYAKCIIVATDKGSHHPSKSEYKNSFSFQQEGSISATVNFHAINALTNPDIFLITDIDEKFDMNIRTNVMGWGLSSKEKDQLIQNFDIYNKNNIYNYAMTSREMNIEKNMFSYPYLKHLLRHNNYDPYLFINMSKNFQQKCYNPSQSLKQDFYSVLKEVSKRIFSLNHRIAPSLSACYRAIDELDAAIEILHTHRRNHGEDYMYCLEMGLIKFHQGYYDQANVFLSNSLEKNPKCKLSKQLIDQINAPLT